MGWDIRQTKKLIACRNGTVTLEHGLLLALVGIAVIGAGTRIGTDLDRFFGDSGQKIAVVVEEMGDLMANEESDPDEGNGEDESGN